MTRLSLPEIEARFRDAMRAAGVPYDGDIDLSGKLTRFQVVGDRKGRRDGWHVAYADGIPCITFGWWGRLDVQTFVVGNAETFTSEERAAHAKRIEAAKRQREREGAQRRDKAAGLAATIWNKATSAPTDHPYLTRKGVPPHSLRVTVWRKWERDDAGRWIERQYPDALLVPLFNAKGNLCNLQAILPARDFPGERDKDFLSGAEKSGCFHVLGTPQAGKPLLLCEGFATGASLHEATGHAVVIAFDCGNLKPVALAVRAKWPDVALLIAGDNDRHTEGNPGSTKAREAAEAVGARWCVADFEALPDAGKATDYNDLHVLAGAAEVVRQIDAALAAEPCLTPEPSPEAAPSPVSSVPPRFTLNPPGLADGLYFNELDREGNARAPRWIAAPLDIPALTRDASGAGWGCLCVFDDPDHAEHRLIIPAEKLRGDGLEALGMLLDQGLRVSPAGKRLLVEYLQTAAPKGRARITRRTGWQDVQGGRVFVLPSGAVGTGGEEWVFEGNAEHYRVAGTLAEWREHVALPCRGNSRLVFSVAVAFAAPLMRLASVESGGGFHWRGDSSLGKSLLLELCASVIGSPEKVPKWNATGVGLEGLAAAYCDAALPLDEIKMVDPKQAATSAYLLTSGQDKARGRAEGGLRTRLSWRGLILSSGEISLGQHVQEAGGKNYAGQDVRLCDLPAAASDLGVFDTLHDAPSSKALHDRLSRAVRKSHGTPFPAWLEIVTRADAVELSDFVRAMTDRFEREFLTDAASGQARRVATRFALIAAAGELATQHGLTGWDAGETLKAAGRLFGEWLRVRGGEGRSEDRDMLRQVRLFLEAHGEGRFTDWHRAGDDHAPKTLHRAGYRRTTPDPAQVGEQRIDFFILPEVWRSEICKGFDPSAVARLMVARGFMSARGEAQRVGQVREHIPGIGRVRLFHVLGAFMEADLE